MGKRPPSLEDVEHGLHNPLPYPPPPPPPPPPPSQSYPRPPFRAPMPEPWLPWLVPLNVIANFSIFAYTMYVNDCPARSGGSTNCVFSDILGRLSFQPVKENIMLGPSISTLMKLGALQRSLVQHDQPWRLLSCIWLHAGVIHLMANMVSLLCIGIRLEQEFGFLRVGILYLLSGIGGSLMSCLTDSKFTRVSVGASGALFGLLGAMLSELITNWSIYENKCTALLTLIMIIALNLSVGFLPHVDNSAHFGGFVAGFFLGFVLLRRPQYGYVSRKYIPHGYDVKHKKSKYKCCQHVLLAISLVILVVGYSWALDKVFKGQTLRNTALENFN